MIGTVEQVEEMRKGAERIGDMTHKVGHDIWVEGINKGKIKMPPLPKVWRDTTPPLRIKKSEGVLERKKKKKAKEAKKAEHRLWGG